MIDVPHVIGPPDLLVVEVLEAFPGRPITGERLVEPDGTIDLGFYGNVHVRGLTALQAKEKIVLHLRKFLSDELLGLIMVDPRDEPVKYQIVAPREVDRVFVRMSAFYSGHYYIDGDVAKPGRLPFTGSETVLDVLNNAGGLMPTADPKHIRLIRPGHGGKPAKVYPIDLNAILEGDAQHNYQIFPGDRLIVGRDAMVTATIRQDRQAAAFQTVVNSILQLSLAARSVASVTPELKPEQREGLMREWFDLWWKSAQKPDGPAPDEATFRELLLKMYKGAPDANKPATPETK
jgi:polysaccharide export outer membrane protein